MECEADMVAFVLDTYGRMGHEAVTFINKIFTQSSLASPSPYGMDKADFRSRLLVLWHRHNALVLTQWSSRARSDALRRAKSRSHLVAPVPLVPVAGYASQVVA